MKPLNWNTAEFVADAMVDATLLTWRNSPSYLAAAYLDGRKPETVLEGLRMAWKRLRKGSFDRQYVEQIAAKVKEYSHD